MPAFMSEFFPETCYVQQTWIRSKLFKLQAVMCGTRFDRVTILYGSKIVNGVSHDAVLTIHHRTS
jgi:hypothetical protein